MVNKYYTPLRSNTPKPAKFGLLNSKTLVDLSGQSHWESGIDVEEFSCSINTRIVDICDTNTSVDITEADGESSQEYVPFAIQTEYECSTFGFEANDYFQKAVDSMELCQGKAVEYELWEGGLSAESSNASASNRYLASPDAVDVTPDSMVGGVSSKQGLALLEQALATSGCGARGFIHVTRSVGSVLASDLITDEGDVMETLLGNYVVAGTGYTGTGPGNTDPGDGKSWMYATGNVNVFLSEIATTPDQMSQAVNTSNNTVTVTAEKIAAVTFDGCQHYAVLVDQSLDF